MNELIGPYAITATAINVAICSTVYSRACVRAFNYKISGIFMPQSKKRVAPLPPVVFDNKSVAF